MATLLPPGLEGDLTKVTSGGDDTQWMTFDKTKFYTNAFIIQNGKLLLGYKKRGFGKNKYNGFGGKVEPGETSLEAAVRELKEEAGIEAPLEHAGTLLFLTEGAEWAFHIDIYRAEEYTGVITETEEMRPQWFTLPSDDSSLTTTEDLDASSIPFDSMWADDRFWMPFLLSKRHFAGRTDFYSHGETVSLQKWWFGVDSNSTG